MTAIETQTRYTPDDLLTMPDGNHYELVDGCLVEKVMGFEQSFVASRLFFFLMQFVNDNDLGWPVVEGSYRCFPKHPDHVRLPDVSYVAKQRMPGGQMPTGHCTVAPDLAVEVISPSNNSFHEVQRKVQEYLDAGVRLVWVIDPPTRTIHAYRPGDDNVRLLREADTLDGADALPGFRCDVSELFKTPE